MLSMSRSRIESRVLFVAVMAVSLLSWVPRGAAAEAGDAIHLDVKTPAYTIDDRSVTVPGYTSIATPGAPQLPVYGSIIELPLTGDWQLTYEDIGSQLLEQRVAIPAVPVPQWPDELINPAVDLPSAVPVADRPDPAIYQADAFYPSSVVEWGEAQRDGDRRIVPVRVYPFQYNPVTRQLRYHPDVRITVTVNRSAGQSSAPLADPRLLFQPKHDPLATGSAGAHLGRSIATTTTKATYSPTSISPGRSAPAYMSPTERPSWSASTISTSDGGIACASVPLAVIAPVAIVRL